MLMAMPVSAGALPLRPHSKSYLCGPDCWIWLGSLWFSLLWRVSTQHWDVYHFIREIRLGLRKLSSWNSSHRSPVMWREHLWCTFMPFGLLWAEPTRLLILFLFYNEETKVQREEVPGLRSRYVLGVWGAGQWWVHHWAPRVHLMLVPDRDEWMDSHIGRQYPV